MSLLGRRHVVPIALVSLVLLVLYGSACTRGRVPSLRSFKGSRRQILPVAPSIDLLKSNNTNAGAFLRILPIGDSITEGYGSSDKNGWRLQLRSMLVGAGYDVQYIGSVIDGEKNADNHHEGFGAHSISQIYNRVVADEAILALNPNLVLLHAGTNDVDRAPPDEPYESAPDRLAKLIDFVLQRCPDAAMIVATIIQDDHAGVQARVDAFNEALPEIVSLRAAKGQRIAVVDQKGIGGKDLADMVHPTDAGYKKMAQNWFDKIRRLPEGWILMV